MSLTSGLGQGVRGTGEQTVLCRATLNHKAVQPSGPLSADWRGIVTTLEVGRADGCHPV